MACRRHFAIVFAACLLTSALSVPADLARRRRGFDSNELDSSSETAPIALKSSEGTPTPSTSPVVLDSFEDDDDDDEVFSEPMQTSPTTGSNLFSLLRLAGALFPSSSGGNPLLQILKEIGLPYNQGYGLNYGNLFLRRSDVGDNEIDIDDAKDLKPPPFQRQETEESSSSESEEDSQEDQSHGSDEPNNAAEESIEHSGSNGSERASEQNADSSNGDDYSDEPPEGDGQGGGVLGILAGLSGGEDGESDLGSLLATVSGIVANLSGDGFDLNALVASGLGLFVGLLSEGEENPGAIIASYLLTSLDTITGGGAQNNGAFFGTLVNKLVKGTSARDGAGSSGAGQSALSPLWTFKMDILRAILQLGASVIGSASSSSSNAIAV